MSVEPTSEMICGVNVKFPYKAYPSQLAMVSQILRALQHAQNCIIESPTGSGKTLSLLCATLSWQQSEYEKLCNDLEIANDVSNIWSPESDRISPGRSPSVWLSSTVSYSQASPLTAKLKRASFSPLPSSGGQSLHSETKPSFAHHVKKLHKKYAPPGNYFIDINDDDDDDDFKPAKRCKGHFPVKESSKKINSFNLRELQSASDECLSQRSPKSHSNEQHCVDVHMEAEQKFLQCVEDVDITSGSESVLYKPVCKRRISKIYYGTRTHRQIAQVVRELKKTVHKEVRMSVLGSRDHTCIHPIVSKEPAKNEACHELLARNENETCLYFHGANKIKTQVGLASYGLNTAWDIEDLILLGKSLRACPYYASRGLKEEADIVFCPYNYIIDPFVRESMDISLKDVVLILDEAHNIEDAAREAASWTVTEYELHSMLNDLEKIKHHHRGFLLQCYAAMTGMITRLYSYVMKRSKTLAGSSSYEQQGDIMTGLEMVTILKGLDMGPEHLENLKTYFRAVKEEDGNVDSTVKEKLSSLTVMGLNALFTILRYLYKENLKYVEDYRVAITKTFKYNRMETSIVNGLKSRRSAGFIVNLHFWCLNPAVAFADIKDEVRTIILTSGTLAPFDSFQSELGVPFAVKLETSHVVKSSQVWVRSVGVGPSGGSLNAIFQNAETFQFQDEVGEALLQICKVVPYGVLCFLPSYSLLDKLLRRWQNTGLWESLEAIKVIVCEERSANKENFVKAMNEFFVAIRDCDDTKNGATITGALLIAVCRGKVSEGLDFPDNYARAVVTIGIPFPNVKDLQIQLKRAYNNQLCKSRGLLNGSSWYEIQAYRALNQALGRCIRHKDDWGAVILLDDRFAKQERHTKNLSKWIRNSLSHFSEFDKAMMSLKEFIKNQELAQVTHQGSVRKTPSVVHSDDQDLFSASSSSSPHFQYGFNVDGLQKMVGSNQLNNAVEILPSSSASSRPFRHSIYQPNWDLPLNHFSQAPNSSLENSSPSNTTQHWTMKNYARKETFLGKLQDFPYHEKSRVDTGQNEMLSHEAQMSLIGRNEKHTIYDFSQMNLPHLVAASSEVAGDISENHIVSKEMLSEVINVSLCESVMDALAPIDELYRGESPPLF